jgi:large subunit ribosomal protein L24
MQKVLRINLLARNQALKAARRKNLKEVKAEWRTHDERQIAVEKAQRGFVKDERRHRREDWIAGLLAPKRNVGEKEKLLGTVEGLFAQGPSFPERARLGPKGNGWDPVGSEGLEGEQKEWEGYGNEGNIVVGDRVCVVHGHENLIGRIGKVKEVSAERRQLTVDGVNMVRTRYPFLWLPVQPELTGLCDTRPILKCPSERDSEKGCPSRALSYPCPSPLFV